MISLNTSVGFVKPGFFRLETLKEIAVPELIEPELKVKVASRFCVVTKHCTDERFVDGVHLDEELSVT